MKLPACHGRYAANETVSILNCCMSASVYVCKCLYWASVKSIQSIQYAQVCSYAQYEMYTYETLNFSQVMSSFTREFTLSWEFGGRLWVHASCEEKIHDVFLFVQALTIVDLSIGQYLHQLESKIVPTKIFRDLFTCKSFGRNRKTWQIMTNNIRWSPAWEAWLRPVCRSHQPQGESDLQRTSHEKFFAHFESQFRHVSRFIFNSAPDVRHVQVIHEQDAAPMPGRTISVATAPGECTSPQAKCEKKLTSNIQWRWNWKWKWVRWEKREWNLWKAKSNPSKGNKYFAAKRLFQAPNDDILKCSWSRITWEVMMFKACKGVPKWCMWCMW